MPRNLVAMGLICATALLLPLGWARVQEGQGEKKQKEGIKAEVRGILHFEHGHGYFVSIKCKKNPERENRVWLPICEKKLLVRELEGLKGKAVIAKGELEQMSEDVDSSVVPSHGMYLDDFTIEGAEAK